MPDSKSEDDQGTPPEQNSGGSVGDDGLAMQLSEAARALQQAEDPDETLRTVVQAAIDLIPGAQEGSISVVAGRTKVTSEAASSERPRIIDALQEQTGQGPCLSAVYDQTTVRVEDMSTESRWPDFAQRAAAAGAASMLALQLFVAGEDLGALNLYSDQPGAFDDESEHVGMLFASHAAVAYSAARRESQLLTAVGTRELIGQAQGVLMERHKIASDEAFRRLVKASQRRNVKLRELAEELLHSGELGS